MNTWVEEDMTDVSCRQTEPDEEFFKVSECVCILLLCISRKGDSMNIFCELGPVTPKFSSNFFSDESGKRDIPGRVLQSFPAARRQKD